MDVEDYKDRLKKRLKQIEKEDVKKNGDSFSKLCEGRKMEIKWCLTQL